ncbi:SWIM zinc finger domain-containing protein [Cohnella suwonensis]|uniref:SWIM zinc finger domain-containing protein n=1 Tax=Cohnella suwonensis TaxID=696072 RepID=A0ABW0LW62_9BACL
MIPTYEIDDDQWDALVRDAAKVFDDVTINRGFQYYKQGRVVKLTMPEPRQIAALVEGSELYRVSANLEWLERSRCNCPVSYNCKHAFAALLKYADVHGRPVHALVNARSREMPKAAPKANSYHEAKLQAAKKASEDESALRELAARLPSAGAEEWHRYFAAATERLMQGARNAQFVDDVLAAIVRLKPSMPRRAEDMFAMHARLFVLSKLSKQPQDQSGYVYSYLAFHTHHAAEDVHQSIAKTFEEGILASAEDGESYAGQTIAYLRKEMLKETNDAKYFLQHYLGAWLYRSFAPDDERRACADELLELDRSDDGIATASAAASLAIAVARAAMLQRIDDEAARKALRQTPQAGALPSEILSYFFALPARAEQWQRLTDWLEWAAPKMNFRRNQDVRPYAEYWEIAARHLPEAEERMWDVLASRLPQSRQLYEEKLLARGRWERWMDYHLSQGSDPLEFRVTDLQPVEKNAPELLLPFYHQAIERYVLQKNRDGYKIAVRLLKRLAKLYKKLKQERRWELFLEGFASRNSRLRALQEELKKGNLLS